MSIIKNLYIIFIRKLLCAVTLSRHFHVVTTASHALCAVCSVHSAYQIFYSNRLSAIIENIAKDPMSSGIFNSCLYAGLCSIDICFIIYGENVSKFPVIAKFSTKQLVQPNVSQFCPKFTQGRKFCSDIFSGTFSFSS